MASPQIVSHVVPFPQSIPAKEPISQLELGMFLSLRNRLDELAEQVAGDEAMLRSRLECGAIVEPGIHVAELKENHRRNVAWKAVAIRLAGRLKMNGEAYARRVIASTRSTRTISLDVH